MELDKVDLELISILYDINDDRTVSTTSLAKKIIDPSDRDTLVAANSLINSKLNKLINYGILSRAKDDEGIWRYTISEEDILVTDGNLSFEYDGEDNYRTVDLDDIIFLPKDEGLYVITYIPEKDRENV